MYENRNATDRNTSTYVEKIKLRKSARVRVKKHLHIRGENNWTANIKRRIVETPPHTWRKS